MPETTRPEDYVRLALADAQRHQRAALDDEARRRRALGSMRAPLTAAEIAVARDRLEAWASEED